MIQGLRYHFTTVELTKHMTDRADYHAKRAAEKETALPGIRDALEKIKANAEAQQVSQMSKMSNSYHMGEPDKDLETDIRNHKNKALVFHTLALHLVQNETYDLSEADLIRLEILSNQ